MPEYDLFSIPAVTISNQRINMYVVHMVARSVRIVFATFENAVERKCIFVPNFG